jgi:hypothetical protein
VGSSIFTLICFLYHKFDSLSTLTIVPLIVLPYTVFSVYYQWQIVKKWCRLCLVIQAILVLEFIVLFNYNALAISSINSVYLLIISLLLPTAIWAFIKPSLEKARTLPDLERSVMTYKYNTNLFTNLLENQRCVHKGVSNITAGNPEALVLITVVSNLFCGLCIKAHETVEKLLGGYADYIKAEYVFTGNPQSEAVIKYLCGLPEEVQRHEALHD